MGRHTKSAKSKSTNLNSPSRNWKKWSALLFLLAVVAISAVLAYTLAGGREKPSEETPKITLKKLSAVSFTLEAKRPVRFLLLGSDSRSESIEGLSDAILIVQINPDRSANLVSFPRDSYLEIPGYGRQKMNAAFRYGGSELTARTIEDYSGLEMDYYLATTFAGFTRMIDGIGGLEISLERSIYDRWSGANLSAGLQKLDGGQALALARSRHIPGGDFGRAANHQKIAAAVFRQERNRRKTIFGYMELLPLVLNNVETNTSLKEMFDLARLVFSVDPNRIKSEVLSGSATTIGGASVVILDEDSAQETFAKLRSAGSSTEVEVPSE